MFGDDLWKALEKFANYIDFEVIRCSKNHAQSAFGFEGRADFQNILANSRGMCATEDRLIWVEKGSGEETFTLAHEIAHAILDQDIEKYWKNKEFFEMRANRIGFLVITKAKAGWPTQGYRPMWDKDQERDANNVADRILEFYHKA